MLSLCNSRNCSYRQKEEVVFSLHKALKGGIANTLPPFPKKNKKMRTILYLVSLLLPLNGFSQSGIIFTSPRSLLNGQVIDTTRYKIHYTYTFKTSKTQKNPERDIIILQIGRKYTKSYSYNLYKIDSLSDVWKQEGKRVVKTYPQSTQREVLYTSLTDKIITTLYRTFTSAPILYFQEDIPAINWKIEKAQKQVLGYNCTKASANYRGRNYTAWFAPSIPLAVGPWKFTNLPGLILEVSDDLGEVAFVAEAITHDKAPIYFWDWTYTKSTRQQARKTIARMFKHPAQFLRSIEGLPQVFTSTGPLGDGYTCPYNPIELE